MTKRFVPLIALLLATAAVAGGESSKVPNAAAEEPIVEFLAFAGERIPKPVCAKGRTAQAWITLGSDAPRGRWAVMDLNPEFWKIDFDGGETKYLVKFSMQCR